MKQVCLSILGSDSGLGVVDSKWAPFESILAEYEMQVIPLGDCDKADYFISVEWDKKSFKAVRSCIPREKRLLICVEPYSVHPEQYTSFVRSSFGRIVTLSEEIGPNKFDELWDGGHLPPYERLEQEILGSMASKRIPGSICMLNANKFSSASQSLYGLRFSILKAFGATGVPIYLGGHGWEDSYVSQLKQFTFSSLQVFRSGSLPNLKELRPRNVRCLAGVNYVPNVQDTIGFFQKFEYGIAIENQLGYVTEKVMNVIRGGGIPLYYGSDPEKFGVPSSSVVDIRMEYSGDFLKAYADVESSPKLKDAVRRSGREWILSGEASARWGVLEGQQKLARQISNWSNNEPSS